MTLIDGILTLADLIQYIKPIHNLVHLGFIRQFADGLQGIPVGLLASGCSTGIGYPFVSLLSIRLSIVICYFDVNCRLTNPQAICSGLLRDSVVHGYALLCNLGNGRPSKVVIEQ